MFKRSKYEISYLRKLLLRDYERNNISRQEMVYEMLAQGLFPDRASCDYWLRRYCPLYAEWYDKTKDEELYKTRHRTQLSPKTNYSRRELSRRASIVLYNQFKIDEKELERRLLALFLPGDHKLNSTTITDALELHLWIAQRSRRYIEFLRDNNPNILTELKYRREKQQRSSPRSMFAAQQALAAERNLITSVDVELAKEKFLKTEKPSQS